MKIFTYCTLVLLVLSIGTITADGAIGPGHVPGWTNSAQVLLGWDFSDPFDPGSTAPLATWNRQFDTAVWDYSSNRYAFTYPAQWHVIISNSPVDYASNEFWFSFVYEYQEGWPALRHTIYSSIESFGTEPQTNTDGVIYLEEYFKANGTEVQPPDTDGKDVVFARFTQRITMSPDLDYEEIWIGVDILTNPVWMSHNPLREVYISTYATYATLSSPFFLPDSTYTNVPIDVVVTCAVDGVTIHYTTDGSEPVQTNAVVANGGTVLVDRSMTLMAKAWKDGWIESAVGTSSNYILFVKKPDIDPPGGNFSTPTNAVVTIDTSGADMYYTTNGIDPTITDLVVTNGEAIPIFMNVTQLKVRGFKDGWDPSEVNSALFTVPEPAALGILLACVILAFRRRTTRRV